MTDGKRISQETLEETWKQTNDCYERATKIVGYNTVDLRRMLLIDNISQSDIDHKFEVLDAVYRKLLCDLPTEVLDNVVAAFKSGQQNRAQKTIDTITSELLERELNEKGRHT